MSDVPPTRPWSAAGRRPFPSTTWVIWTGCRPWRRRRAGSRRWLWPVPLSTGSASRPVSEAAGRRPGPWWRPELGDGRRRDRGTGRRSQRRTVPRLPPPDAVVATPAPGGRERGHGAPTTLAGGPARLRRRDRSDLVASSLGLLDHGPRRCRPLVVAVGGSVVPPPSAGRVGGRARPLRPRLVVGALLQRLRRRDSDGPRGPGPGSGLCRLAVGSGSDGRPGGRHGPGRGPAVELALRRTAPLGDRPGPGRGAAGGGGPPGRTPSPRGARLAGRGGTGR